jgi:hypothetical protein
MDGGTKSNPYARWCGTRGWLSESVTGKRVLASLVRYCEGRLRLVVMRAVWIVLHYGPKARV